MHRHKFQVHQFFLHAFFVLVSLCFILPLLLVVSVSFSSEHWVTSGGFSLIPREFTTEAYQLAFRNPHQIVQSYLVTISQALLGALSSNLVAGLIAYPLSRSNFRFKAPITGFIFFTMLFGAGTIPNYIVFTRYYHLGNSFWIYILPGITGGAWSTMVYRTFFKSLPESLFEAAKIDGAKELRIFFTLVLPLSTPIFASLGFMSLVGRWNNYATSLIYIRDPNLFTLQYLLQKILNEAEFLKAMMTETALSGVHVSNVKMPSETLKYAMCVIAAGPMVAIFPFFQKYFSQGLTIGAVKG